MSETEGKKKQKKTKTKQNGQTKKGPSESTEIKSNKSKSFESTTR
jgi:hypothetical protein